jgi:hypothetical protein
MPLDDVRKLWEYPRNVIMHASTDGNVTPARAFNGAHFSSNSKRVVAVVALVIVANFNNHAPVCAVAFDGPRFADPDLIIEASSSAHAGILEAG